MNKLKKKTNLSYLKNTVKRFGYLNTALLFICAILLQLWLPSTTKAGLVTNRSLELSSSAAGDISTDANGTAVPPGEGGNGAKAKHTVTFTMDTSAATTGSIIIMYCTSPIFSNTCTTPTGMTADPLTAVTVSGVNATSPFAIDEATTNASINGNPAVSANGVCNGAGTTRDNCVVMKRAAAQLETLKPTVTIEYGGGAADYIQNPIPVGNQNYTFYARILVFSDTNYSTLVDYGGLAASTTQQVDITAKVQEVLRFSVGTTPTAKVSDAACTPYNDSGALVIGDSNGVLDSNLAYYNHSYFRINTNTVNGTVITYSGDTLKSGANDINEIGLVAAASAPGTEQFGLAIDQEGTDYEFVALTKDAVYANGHPSASPPQFAFSATSKTAPITIATAPAGITCDTGVVRYIANISTSTPAGIYRTTITYIATGTY